MDPEADFSSLREYPGGQVTTEQTGRGVTPPPGLKGGSLGMHLNCAHSFLEAGVLVEELTSGLSRENAWFGRGAGRPIKK